MGEILKVFEGRKPATGSGCKVLADLWKKVDSSVSAIVDETTFADLIARSRSTREVVPSAEPGLFERSVTTATGRQG